jgi:hypothetical protein
MSVLAQGRTFGQCDTDDGFYHQFVQRVDKIGLAQKHWIANFRIDGVQT